jgi:hypothetical protein
LADKSRSTFTPKQPGGMSENESVTPIDTIIYRMDKSFSGTPNYDPVVETRTMENQAISEWPSNLNPAGIPLKIHQASITSTISGSNNEHIGNDQPQDGMRYRRQQNSTSMQPQSQPVSTEVAGKAVPNPHHTVDQSKKQQPKISNPPQTKSQQQRLALQKLSQAVSKEMGGSSMPVDLEQAVLRILAGSNELPEEDDEQTETARGSISNGTQNRRSNKVFLNKSEAIKAAQAISNLIKQSPGSAYSQPRKSNQNFATNPKVCDLCGYAVARSCDLKKHMKRHEKPYGCTYPKCHKRFGAKSDWKRHENSQHFQLEAFRCDQTTTGQICGEHFLREEHFKKHLEAQHKLSDSQQISAEVKRRKIGKNCQQQFWCGFHGDIIELREKRNAAWDERFDHIAHHFEKEKRSIEAWVCAEENKTKKELLKELDRYVFDDENERGPASQGAPMGVPQGPPPPPAPTMNEQSVSRKRGASDEIVGVRSQKKKKHHDHRDRQHTEIVRYCVCISMLWQLLELIFVSANVTTVPVACCKLGARVVNTSFALSVDMSKSKRLLGHNVCLKAMSRCYQLPQR